MNLAVDSDPKGQDVSWLDDLTWSKSNQQIFIGCFLRAGDTTRVVGPRARPGRALRPDSCAAPGAASLHQPGAAWPGYSRGEIQAYIFRLDANTGFPLHITHCVCLIRTNNHAPMFEVCVCRFSSPPCKSFYERMSAARRKWRSVVSDNYMQPPPAAHMTQHIYKLGQCYIFNEIIHLNYLDYSIVFQNF